MSQQSNKKPVVLVAMVGLNLLISIACVAWYTLAMQTKIMDELFQTCDLQQDINTIGLQWAEVKAAWQHHKESGDAVFEKQAVERVQKICELASRTESLLVPENAKRLAECQNIIQKLERFHREFFDLEQQKQAVLREHLKLRDEVLECLEKLDDEANRKPAGVEKITQDDKEYVPARVFFRQGDMGVLRVKLAGLHASVLLFLFNKDPAMAEQQLKHLQEDREQVGKQLEEIRKLLMTPSALSTCMSLIDVFQHQDGLFKRLVELKQMQTSILSEIETDSKQADELMIEMQDGLAFRTEEIRKTAMATSRSLAVLLIIVVMVSLIIFMIIILVAIGMSSQSRLDSGRYDPYSTLTTGQGETPAADLKQVAEKLQEVVNLMRR